MKPYGHFAQRTLSRRSFLTVLGLGAGTLALAGCDRAPSASTRRPNKVQLVYQDWQTDWFPLMVREMLEQFHETHPNIRVFYTPDLESDVEASMLDDMKAGTAPDVFAGCCTFFPIWAQAGYTLDLSTYVREDLDQATIDDWARAQYNAFFLKDGTQYGLPKYHGALGLYFNKDLFDRHRVDRPDSGWDHDDYTEAMHRLTHDRDGDGNTDLWGSMIDISWDRIQMHVNGWGGHLVDPTDASRCVMDQPEAMAAMSWLYERMRDERVMATFLDVHNVETRRAFIEESIAMVEDGSWALRDILEGAKFRVGVAPFPAGPVRRVTLATTDGWGIYANTQHPDAAWEFLKFLISEDYGRAMARAEFLQPARASLVDDWVGFIQEEFPVKAKNVDVAAFADGHLKAYSVTAEIFEDMAQAKRLTYDAWDSIYTLGQGGLEQIQQACGRINALNA